MITLNNRKYEVIDAHAHVWKEFKENVLEIHQLKKLEMDVYDKMVKNFSLYHLNIKITMCI